MSTREKIDFKVGDKVMVEFLPTHKGPFVDPYMRRFEGVTGVVHHTTEGGTVVGVVLQGEDGFVDIWGFHPSSLYLVTSDGESPSIPLSKIDKYLTGLIEALDKSPLDWSRESGMTEQILRGLRKLAE